MKPLLDQASDRSGSRTALWLRVAATIDALFIGAALLLLTSLGRSRAR